MEKDFSQGLKDLEFIDNRLDERSIKSIPIPEIVPEPPNLSTVPKEVLQSGVIETLISQNDDLMARLSVQIRRSHVYETEIEAVKRNLERTERLYQSHRDQLAIWREKEKKWLQKFKSTEDFAKKLEGEFSWLEFRYAELTKSKTETETQLNAELKSLADRLHKSERHIDRVRKYVRPQLNQLKQQIMIAEKHLIDQQCKFNVIHDEKLELERKSTAQTDEISQTKMSAKAELMRLTDSHEREIIDLKNEIDHYKNIGIKLKNKMKDFDNVIEKAAVLENKVIHLKRKRQLVEEQIFIESEKSKSTQIKFKKQLSDFEQETLEARTKQTRLERKNKILQSDNTDLGKRLDALQKDWTEKNRTIAELKDKVEQLELINSDFSEKLTLQQQNPMESSVPTEG